MAQTGSEKIPQSATKRTATEAPSFCDFWDKYFADLLLDDVRMVSVIE